MTEKPAFIFDLDGTLLDSIKDLALTANDGLMKSGYEPLPEPVFYLLVGNGIRELCRRSIMLSRLQKTEAIYEDRNYSLSKAVLDRVRDRSHNLVEESVLDEFTRGFLVAYRRNWTRHTVPFPGVVELLDRLSAAGIRSAVLSNKADAFVQEICRRFFPGDRLAACLGERAELKSKPDPAGAFLLADRLGSRPEEIFFVGDSDVDMVTAKRAGMKAVGVSWGFRSVAELTAAGAAVIVSSPREIGALAGVSV